MKAHLAVIPDRSACPTTRSASFSSRIEEDAYTTDLLGLLVAIGVWKEANALAPGLEESQRDRRPESNAR